MSQKTARLVRRIALVLLGLAVVVTLLGGLGTSCVAFNAGSFGKAFEKFISYTFEYQLFVYVSVITALVGIAATWAMVKGKTWSYIVALLVLIVGLATAGAQMYYTSTLKQVSFFSTPPTNMRFYVTLVALLFFLVLRLPGIWKQVNLLGGGDGKSAGTAAGLTACVMGLVTVTTPLWASAGHVVDGYNLVNVLDWQLAAAGWGMIVGGVLAIAPERWGVPLRRAIARVRRVSA